MQCVLFYTLEKQEKKTTTVADNWVTKSLPSNCRSIFPLRNTRISQKYRAFCIGTDTFSRKQQLVVLENIQRREVTARGLLRKTNLHEMNY